MKYLIPFLLIACLHADEIVLQNSHISIVFTEHENNFSNTKISRTDGSDDLELNNDEFEILMFDDSRYTRKHYMVKEAPELSKNADGQQTLTIGYLHAVLKLLKESL